MTRFLKAIMAATGATILFTLTSSTPINAMPLHDVVDTIASSGGHYQWAAASLGAADCSGLVSVAQTLAMGQPVHRLGDTHTLLSGHWPDAIPGAAPDDLFVIGVSPAHMTARVDGVNIESRGGTFRVGDDAASPWDGQFTRQFHVDPAVLAI